MFRKVNIPNLNDLISRYKAGETMYELAEEAGVMKSTLRRYFLRAGVTVRTMQESSKIRSDRMTPEQRRRNAVAAQESRRIQVNPDMVKRYLSGEGAVELAYVFGIDPGTFIRQLTKLGIKRNASESRRLAAAHIAPATKSRMTEARAAARRGTTDTLHTKILRAKTREREGLHRSQREIVIADMLQERGFTMIPQKGIGPYNVDLAYDASSIAVEVIGPWQVGFLLTNGTVGRVGNHPDRWQRLEYIKYSGWTVIEVLVQEPRHPITVGCINYLVTHLQSGSGYKPVRGKHLMVWGDGEIYTRRKAQYHAGA